VQRQNVRPRARRTWSVFASRVTEAERAAITSSGAIDASFGGPQGLFTRIGTSSAVTALVQQTDGKLVALGGCEDGIALARYFGP
jgi:hypothetical protein